MGNRCAEPPEALNAFQELLRKHGIPKLRYDGSEPGDAPDARRTEAVINLNHCIEPTAAQLSVIPTAGPGSWCRDDVAFAVKHETVPERFSKKALLVLKMWEVAIPTEYSLLLAKGERYPFWNWHVTDAGFMQFHWNAEWDDYEPLLIETSPADLGVGESVYTLAEDVLFCKQNSTAPRSEKKRYVPVSEGVPVADFVDFLLCGVYHEGETCGLTLGNGHWDTVPILKPSDVSRELVNGFFTLVLDFMKTAVLHPGVILAGDARWMPELEKQGTPAAPVSRPAVQFDANGVAMVTNVS